MFAIKTKAGLARFTKPNLLKKKLLCSVLSGSAILSAPLIHSAEPTEAMMAPKVQKSMLLDVYKAGDKLVAVGERGHVLVSTDQGNSWSQSKAPVSQMLTSIDFASSKVGFAVGHDGQVIRTSDGGTTWTLVRDGLKAQALLNEIAVKDYAAEISRVQYLIDEGATEDPDQPAEFAGMTLDEELEELEWLHESAKEKLTEDTVAPPLMDVWMKDELTAFVVGAFGQMFKTSSGGRSWQNLSRDVGNIDGYHLNTVAGTNDGGIYVAGEAGFLSYSHDLGKTWTVADLGYDGSIFGLVASKDGSTIVATGLRGNTFISKDKGVSWNSVQTGTDYSFSSGVLYGANNLALVGAGGNVAISNDGAKTFTVNTIPQRSSLSSVVAVTNSKLILVGAGGIYTYIPNNN